MLILGVDAAWSENNPSGLALIHLEPGKKPSLIAVARSYEEFLSLRRNQQINWESTSKGAKPDFRLILEKATSLGNEQVKVLALDLPLSPAPITMRRTCDSQVSQAYGKMGAAVHSPSAKYPGPISSLVFEQLSDVGYELLLNTSQTCSQKGLFMEVYPHIAIIEMLGLDYRLPYKVQKRSSYWKHATPQERLTSVFESLALLRTGLEKHVNGMDELIPPVYDVVEKSGGLIRVIKSYEDVLDAATCAWMGYKYVIDEVVGYGADDGMIWGPARRNR